MNAAQIALDNIEMYGEYTATYFADQGYTNVEQYQQACRIAAVLRVRGAQPGERVVLMMLNAPEVMAAFTAIWKIGAVMIPITPMWTAREVRFVLEDSGARIVITSPELAARAQEAAAGLPADENVLALGATSVAGVSNIEPEIAAATPFTPLVDCQPDDLAMLLYTSGTTGNPKGVMLSHENLIFVADAAFQLNSHLQGFRGMQVLPLSHIYGVLVMNVGARMGARSYILKHFDAQRVLQIIQEFKVERLSLVPTMLTLLINHPDRANYDVSSLLQVGSGGAPLSETTRLEFERLFDCKVMQGYGMSETAGILTSYHTEDTYRVGSVGKALPGIELCVMDGEQRILPAGQVGELCSRGKHLMRGYYNNPEATQATLMKGWLQTGDIGWLDADGYVYITDRKKDLVIKGGENIAPREIEECLYAHPAVAEVAVFGVPDPVYGENLVAAIVLRPGQSSTEAELKQHLSGAVTKFKIPARIIFLDVLPKNSSGKILKRTLREQWS